jgi:hypothetical protein
MHYWEDESFDWRALDDAIDMMASFMRFWGRIGLQSKEKYGTARLYVTFWDGSLHGLMYPGHCFSRFPQWLWSLDIMYISRFIQWTRLSRLVQWYQSKIYALAYARALCQFPHIKTEIVIAADFPELIKDYKKIMKMYRFKCFMEKIHRWKL